MAQAHVSCCLVRGIRLDIYFWLIGLALPTCCGNLIVQEGGTHPHFFPFFLRFQDFKILQLPFFCTLSPLSFLHPSKLHSALGSKSKRLPEFRVFPTGLFLCPMECDGAEGPNITHCQKMYHHSFTLVLPTPIMNDGLQSFHSKTYLLA